MLALPTLKRCASCGQIKDETNFYRDPERRSGLNPWCKKCHLARSRAYQAQLRARPVIPIPKYATCCRCGETKSSREFHRNRGALSGITSACKKCLSTAKRVRNLKTHCYRDYYQRNKARLAVYNRQKVLSNPWKDWALQTTRRHRQRGYQISIELDKLIELVKRATECAICGQHLRLSRGAANWSPRSSITLDIIDPQRKTLDNSNIQFTCHRCNRTKLDRSMGEFVEYCQAVINRFNQPRDDAMFVTVPSRPPAAHPETRVSQDRVLSPTLSSVRYNEHK